MHAVAFKSEPVSPPHSFNDVIAEAPLAGEVMGVRIHFDRDEEIFGEDEPAQHVYRVLSGAVRTTRMLSDGRRQIVEFHLAGDVFGLDGDSRHALGAEAVGETVLQVMRRAAYLNGGVEGVAPAMDTLLRKFQRAQAHMLLLGRHTACERVAAFLLDFQARTKSKTVDLPMSRQDIADYLGLTIETVSRTFTQLQAANLIDLVSCRRVALLNVSALERICE